MSLLLNALKQAEKKQSEVVQSVKDESESVGDVTIAQDEGLIEPGLIELEMLPDFDLSDTPAPKNPALEPPITHGKTPFEAAETVTTLADTKTTAGPVLSLAEDVATDTERPEFDLQPTATPPAASPGPKFEPTKPVPAQTLTAEPPYEPPKPDSGSLKSAADRQLAETLINLNKREKNDNRNSLRWVVAVLLIGLIAAVTYLYQLTLPPASNLYPIADAIETEVAPEDLEPAPDDYATADIAALASAPSMDATPDDNTAEGFPAASLSRKTPALTENRYPSEPQPNFRPSENDPSFSIEPAAGYTDSANAIAVKRRQRIPETAALLKEAYRAYQGRDDITATGFYKEVLSLKPHNIDALLGLGAIAERQGNAPQAKFWFEQVLASDGNNAFAQNALARLTKAANPADQESRLKSLIDKGLADAGTHAELGNVYASNQRWRDAQAAYFEAVEKQPEHALYHYNLAIALDRLNKADIALRYYRQAYHLSERQPAPFDRARILQRIQQLEQR